MQYLAKFNLILPFSSGTNSSLEDFLSTGLDFPDADVDFSSPPLVPVVSVASVEPSAFDLSGTSNCWPGNMNEVFKRLRCDSSDGVVSKRAATDVSVSRFPTVYVIVGIVGSDDFFLSPSEMEEDRLE